MQRLPIEIVEIIKEYVFSDKFILVDDSEPAASLRYVEHPNCLMPPRCLVSCMGPEIQMGWYWVVDWDSPQGWDYLDYPGE